MIMIGNFILWNCFQNMVGIREYDIELVHEYQSLLEMSFAL